MGTITKEADHSFANTDITDIAFAPTEDQPDEITAQISREFPPVEKIDLGIPEKATGRLNRLIIRNFIWSIIKMGVGAATAGDGVEKILTNGIHLDITGGCEVATAAFLLGHSFARMVNRDNLLEAVKKSLGNRINKGFLSSLDTAEANPPETPE